jgi:hypothetical protein
MLIFLQWRHPDVCRDSAVGAANRYGLDGPRIELVWGRNFSHQLPVQRVPVPFPEGKAAGAWCHPPTPSRAQVKERVELYLHSSSRPSMVCFRVNFTVLMETLFYCAVEAELSHCYLNCFRKGDGLCMRHTWKELKKSWIFWLRNVK